MQLSRLATPTRLAIVLTAALAGMSACKGQSVEELARKAEERARDSIRPLDHGALDQKIDPAVVKTVQQQLTALNEYMGPIDGKLDQVTLNAFEAFQRNNDIKADGRFDDETLDLLAETASKKQG